MSECEWDLKGTASGCLGYLFPCKALKCLEKQARYILNVRGRAVKGVLSGVRTHLLTPTLLLLKG